MNLITDIILRGPLRVGPIPTPEEMREERFFATERRIAELELTKMQVRKEIEYEDLEFRKEKAIVDLLETAEEVEIEEMGDTNNAFNIGGAVNQSGVAGNIGKENGVSHYRRYKFKRGGQTTETDDYSEGRTEK